MNRQILLLMTALLALPSLDILARTPEQKGLEIAQQADSLDTGWKDMQAGIVMTLRNKHGQETARKNRMNSLEIENDGDRSLIIFDSPADVKGTAFLSHTHAVKADDQWLFLPALKRVKRVSSSNKSGPFMGSEFAYEDISSQEVDKYTYKYLRDETANSREAFVLERYPTYKNSGYTKQVVWMDKKMYQPLKIEFYDRKKVLLKTLNYHDYSQHIGKYWRPGRMEMENHQTGKSTTLAWTGYKFQTGKSKRDFDRNSLKRAR